MNIYVNELLDYVRVRHGGWIIMLDDDNMLSSKFAISSILGAALSRDNLLIYYSYLGRLTPTVEHFANRKVVMGDFDSSNFAFHSNQLHLAQWPSVRCGDFHTAQKLSSQVPTQLSLIHI